MNLSKRMFSFIVTALVMLSASAVFFSNKAYAQPIQPESVTDIVPAVEVKKPEIKTDTAPLDVDALKKTEPVIEKKSEVVTEKTRAINKTTVEIKSIQQKKVSLASDVTNTKNEIETLKAKIAEKKRLEAEQAAQEAERQRIAALPVYTGGSGGGDEGTVAVSDAPAPSRAVIPGNSYEAGQCTWHVKNLRPDLPNNLGNADTWYDRATAMGLPTGQVAQAGAAGAKKVGMHVVYVMEVYGDGTMLVSEMNYDYVAYHQRTAIKNQADFEYIY